MDRCILYSLIILLLLHKHVVQSQSYDKKTLDGMVLKMLWEKVYARYDAKTKEMAIRTIRETGDYEHLIQRLMKVKRDKVRKIINLVGEVMIVYMS
ncbi:uncharacterized protein LOC123668742 isoform X2 [Melitaea cinxia]|uniref:uncharacterized protein LOC123668742 isoform X2 n=1 Tax=Melitaea cinxia TaxID=113334 RepID=UPI001E2713B2|nr:uncharacterized protein LOC123668742 isoform X2 [Melitaea cinxia]